MKIVGNTYVFLAIVEKNQAGNEQKNHSLLKALSLFHAPVRIRNLFVELRNVNERLPVHR
jgi:hypothetical protein